MYNLLVGFGQGVVIVSAILLARDGYYWIPFIMLICLVAIVQIPKQN